MRKFNILVLGTTLEIGGDILSTVRIAKELDKRGHQIFYMSKKGPLSNEFRTTNIIHIENLFVGGHTPRGLVKGTSEILCLLNWNKIDIIHIQTATSIIMAYFARMFSSKHKPVIIWHNRGVRKLTYLLGTRLLINPLTDFVISISDYERDKLVRYGMPPRKVKTIYHGVYLNHSRRKKEINIRCHYNIDSNSPLIVIVARLSWEKGHRYFIEAARMVLKKLAQAKFLIVGDGVLRPKLEKMTTNLGIDKNVIFTGVLTDMSNLYSTIDILVHPSLWESLCNVLLEAMYMGKPIIATNVTVMPEIIDNGVDGILVPPKDAPRIAESILYLLKNKHIAEDIGQAASRKAKILFNMENQINKIEQVYRSLVR